MTSECFRRNLSLHGFLITVAVLTLVHSMTARADEQTAVPVPDSVTECEQLYETGEYERCLEAVTAAIDSDRYGQAWRVLQVRTLFTLGRYVEAKAALEHALKWYPWSIRLKLLARDVYRFNGDLRASEQSLAAIKRLAEEAPWRYTSVADRIVLGQAALLRGSDPKEVLQQIYEPARKEAPDDVAPHVAIGMLAVAKQDLGFATEVFQSVSTRFADEPAAHYGLARALRFADPVRLQKALDKTLALNPAHVDAHLLRAELAIAADDEATAGAALQAVLEVNPHHPSAWAFKSVMAELENDEAIAKSARARALKHWRTNPEVDFLIGRTLSSKYRFEEGAAAQRRALAFDVEYAPARVQLAQDLLRLGEEAEGWELAEFAHEADEYDVTAFNLLELRDRLSEFSTLEDEDFIIRMDKREAAVYGKRVRRLLGRAKAALCQKYGVVINRPIIVEIFPDENDFAVRTFGLPTPGGFLGVCFGNVITANSPATRQQAANPSNWESVLWHEFAHVVTLTATRNRMPRWFSEGVSVYEERQADPAWGLQMNPRFREMILAGEMHPIARLSEAFKNPKTPQHVEFAYFQSSLVIEHLIAEHGMETIVAILSDLRAGVPLNEALDRRAGGLVALEANFSKYATSLAESFAPEADWTRHDLQPLLSDDGDAIGEFVAEHPQNIFALHAQAKKLMADNELEAAKTPLRTLQELNPGDILPENATLLLAEVHGRLGQVEAEQALLAEHVTRDPDALGPGLRLLELLRQTGTHDEIAVQARRLLAINPLLPTPWIALAEASEAESEMTAAVEAYDALLTLRPSDAPRWHFHLARLLQSEDPEAARRHLLTTLERTPRDRDALLLLRSIARQRRARTGTTPRTADATDDVTTPIRE